MSRKRTDDETYTETVIRMDEKLKGIVDSLKTVIADNSNIRKESLENIKELTIHVNYEDGVLQARVKLLEDCATQEKSERKGALLVYKFTIAILSGIIAVLTILKLLGAI